MKKGSSKKKQEDRPSAQGFKLKHFISFLSSLEEFAEPKIHLEQYMTPPDITANLFSILHVRQLALKKMFLV